MTDTEKARPQAPVILLDMPEDGGCEECGWVEATVNENMARDALADCCCGAEGESPYRPTGPATKVRLVPMDMNMDEWTRWYPVDDIDGVVTERNADLVADGEPPLADDLAEYVVARRTEAIEFWRIEVYGDSEDERSISQDAGGTR